MARTSALQKVGNNIRRYRKEAGLSQEKLGNDTELGRSYISGVERATRNPSVKSLERIAKALRVKSSDLLN